MEEVSGTGRAFYASASRQAIEQPARTTCAGSVRRRVIRRCVVRTLDSEQIVGKSEITANNACKKAKSFHEKAGECQALLLFLFLPSFRELSAHSAGPRLPSIRTLR
jgi:hypothetical protein